MSASEDQPQPRRSAGSPGGEPVFLVVGKLGRPHGLKGEMLLYVITDFPERLRPGVEIFVGDAYEPRKIRSRRKHKASLLVALDDVRTAEDAAELTNRYVFVRAEDRPPLPEGEYYHHELIGLQVVDEDGETLGRLEEVISNPANDIYLVRPDQGPEILLPATEEVILEVDLEAGEMRIHLLPGLIDEG